MPLRLSREAVLIERQYVSLEMSRLNTIVDEVMDLQSKNYDPMNKETIDFANDKISQLSARLRELEALL
jgi:hypothetical protein